MILVDSSVWIDFFNEADTLASLQLVKLLKVGDATVGTADLVIFEVLRGFRQGKAVQIAQSYLLDLPTVDIGGIHNAALAAEHYRYLRSRGHTIRSPMDVLLASYCITHKHMLLHRDADFDVMETLRGLKTWPH